MKKAKGSWRSLVAAGLVSALLALPASRVAAQQRYDYMPIPPYAGQEEKDKKGSHWLGWALLIGVGYCVLVGCGGSGSQGSGGTSTQDPSRWPREEERQQKPESPRPDTSIGCAWGDRAYGTCH